MALTKVPSNLDSITATTQSQGDGSTNVATTAYVDTGLANLIDSAPGNLNTLNELAAAMNDNASFFSTVLPLSGGTLTGALTGTTAAFNSGTTNTTATFTSTDAGAGINLTDDSGTSTIQTNGANLRVGVDEDGAVSSSAIQFRVDGSTKTTIDSDGHLGIGIAPVPGASGMKTLHLHSAGNSAYLRLTQSDSGSTATDGFDLISGGTEAYVWNREDGNIRFGVDNAEKMRLTDDGQLQLGTSIGNSTYAGQFNSVANLGSSGANIQTRNGDGLHHFIMRGDNNVAYGRIGLNNHTGSANMRLNPVNALEIDSDNNEYVRINGGTSGGGKFDALHLKHTNTTTTNDGPAIRWEGSYSSSAWQFGEMHAYNNGSGYGANIDLKVHPGTGTQNSSPVLSTRAGFKNGSFQTPGNHQFSFRASGASNPGNNAVIVFDEVQQGNAASCYNTSTGAYQAAIDGWYLVSVGIRYDEISGGADTYTRPQMRYLPDGGSTWQYPHQGKWVDPILGSDFGTGTYHLIAYTVPIYLSNGDQIQIMQTGNSTSSVNHNESHFGVLFVG